MKPLPREAAFDRLWSYSVGFYGVWIGHLGQRFGFFRILSHGPRAAQALAQEAATATEPTMLWLRAAESLRLVTRRGARYALPPRMKTLLVDDEDPAYLGGQFAYLARRSLDFRRLDGFFRTGHASTHVSEDFLEAIHEATKWDQAVFLNRVLPARPSLRTTFLGGARVVDVGCGTGEWIRRVAEAYRTCRFLGLDPHAGALARARRSSRDLGGRARFVRARAEDPLPPGSADIVHFGESLYATSSPSRALRNAFRALRPGGWLVVIEGIVDDAADPTSRGNQLINPMRLDFALQGAAFFTRPQLTRLVARAGFDAQDWFDAGGNVFVLLARKPSPTLSKPVSRTPRGSPRRRGSRASRQR